MAAPARILGRYAVFDQIAEGGMGTVCFGRLIGPAGFARTVAIKRLHPRYARDPQFVARFLDEARLAARVRHPNVLPTLDVEALGDDTFIVMELVLGESAAGLVHAAIERHEPVPIPIAVRILIDTLEGLHAAHEAVGDGGRPLGLVHRDVSPQNVLVGVDGLARVLDFGIAKAALASDEHTGEGVLKGKIGYLAPEQIPGRAARSADAVGAFGVIDRRVDVYAASVMLWELLTGERPFDGTSREERLDAVLHAPVPAPSERRREVSFALDALVLRGMSRAREARFATAHEMALALEDAVEPASARDVGAWVETLAAGPIAERRAILARIDHLPPMDENSEPFMLGGPGGDSTAVDVRTGDLLESTAPHVPIARAQARATAASKASAKAKQTAPPGESGATKWVAVALAAALLGIAGGVFLATRPGPGPTVVGNAGASGANATNATNAAGKPSASAPRANASANAGSSGDCTRAPLADVVEISAGPSGHHTCARTRDGAVFCWGDDREAQLGVGSTEARVGAFEVQKLEHAKQVVAGNAHACAITEGGRVSCWGKAMLLRPTPVLGLADVTALAAGGRFACAQHATGALECWGDDDAGQLGTAQRDAALAAKIDGLPAVDRVATGTAHACAISREIPGAEPAVWCWGANDLGQLGDGTTDRAPHPKPSRVALPIRPVALAAGDKTSFAWSQAGDLFGWGFSVKRPVKVPIAGVDRVAAGGRVTCALRRDRTVSCWGFSDRGVLGVTTDDTVTPVGVADLPAARDVVAGASHACALTDGGEVFCWGANDRGELGLAPDDARHPKPVRVERGCP
jgi:serine/threonine-protein kinase